MSYEKYVFLDESGDQGNKETSSKYFVITLLVTNDKKYLENKLKKFKLKLMKKKKFKKLQELKANNSSDKIRFEVLDIIKEHDAEIFTIILDKNKLYSKLKYKKTKVYNYLTSLIIAECNLNGKSVHFIIDKRVKKKIIREDFDEYIRTKHPKVNFNISHYDSCSSNGLQLVDFACWSVFRNYEYQDTKFLNYIQEKITLRKELFK